MAEIQCGQTKEDPQDSRMNCFEIFISAYKYHHSIVYSFFFGNRNCITVHAL